MQGIYVPWDGHSTCGQIEHQRLMSSIRSKELSAARLAELAEVRRRISEGYYWIRVSDEAAAPRPVYVMYFNHESCVFSTAPGGGEGHTLSWREVEILCPCDVPASVQAAIDVEKVLAS